MDFWCLLAIFELLSDSLTTTSVEPNQCPSHQSILLTQGPVSSLLGPGPTLMHRTVACTYEQKVHFICPLFLQHIILFGRLGFEDNHQTCFCHIRFILFICFMPFFLINRTIMSGLMIWHKMM